MRIALSCCLAMIVASASGCVPVVDPIGTARVRVVHASPDAPAVDICANGNVVFANATYPGVTEYRTVHAGTYEVRVVVAGSGCDSAAVISATLQFLSATDTTAIALNFLAEIEALILEDNNDPPAMGMAKVRFVHASANAPTVDITLPDGTTLFNDIPFKGVSGYIEVPAGTYDLEVRDETGTTTFLFLDDVVLASGKIYTVYAIGLAGGEPALDALISIDN